MLEEIEEPKPVYERISLKILSKLPLDPEEDRIKYLKCKLGIESMLVDVYKTIIIYAIAFLLNLHFQVLIFQLGYVLIRTCGFGAHAKTNLLCLIVSLVVFLGMPYMIKNGLLLNRLSLGILVLINYLIIWIYAPSCTLKNYINNSDKRNVLKKKALICNTIVLVVSIIIQNDFFINYFVLGSFVAGLFMLPIAHKILD